MIPPEQNADFVAHMEDVLDVCRLVERLEIHHTPKHGSWLNIAEIELSALTKQCLDRHIPDKQTLLVETQAWAAGRNSQQKGIDWQFTTTDARIKLKRLYPQYQG